MSVSYDKLFSIMQSRGIKKTHLRNNYGINPKVISNLANNRIVTLDTILTLCEILDCQPGDIMEYIPEKGKK